MARKLRLEYPGAVYHVMSRGDQREDIFLDDVDRHDFVKTLAEVCLNPTDRVCVLKILSLSKTDLNVRVTWQSSKGITYYLQKSTNLFENTSFYAIGSNIVGQAGTTSFIDVNAGNVPCLYRVVVQ